MGLNSIKPFAKRTLRYLKWRFLYPSSYEGKIACIGFQKTGTTSLGKSLEILGYRHASFDKFAFRKLYKKDRIDELMHYASKFESFDDLPWLRQQIFPLLDSKFPGSKFIYLHRDENDWKASLESWKRKRGKDPGDLELAWKNYKEHERFVYEYFKDRSEDLLVLSIKDEKGFQKLGDFLGRAAPQAAFPHLNRSR